MFKYILLIIFSSYTFANILIVSSENCSFNKLNQNDLKNLYLGLTKEINNQQIIVYDRDEKMIREEFITNYLKKTPLLIKQYWVRMLFTGKSKPPKIITLEEWKTIRKEKECSISYILENEDSFDNKRLILEP